MDRRQATTAADLLQALSDGWTEVVPVESVRELAGRFLGAHDLRAADALQLAAASMASEGRNSLLAFVTLDERLADVASREGFTVVGRGA